MFVFKRALSIALSVSFAMPTVTLAKSEKRAPMKQAKFQATTKAHASRMPASKKFAVKPAGPMPARISKKAKTASDLAVYGGQVYQISEDFGRSGRLKSRTMTGPDYAEMLVDKNEDGFVDIIEVTQGDSTTRASWPFRGKFRRMDVERRMKHGIYKAQLLLAADDSAYEIVDQRVYPYSKFNAETTNGATTPSVTTTPAPTATPRRGGLFSRRPRPSPTPRPGTLPREFDIGGFRIPQTFKSTDRRAKECENPIMINSLDALDRALRDADARYDWNMEQILQCQLKKFQPLIMDQTCLDPNGRWNTSVDHIRFGLARVMASHYENPPGPNEKGSYLRCLDHHGWQDSATRVNQFVWQRFRNVSAALMEAGLTAEDFAEIFSRVGNDADCTLPNEIVGPRSGRRVRMDEIAARLNSQSNGTPPTIACSASPNPSRRAEYDNGTIRLFSTADRIYGDTPFCSGRNCTSMDAYASTFFHELIHASGFGTEHHDIVEAAENCCSISSGSPGNRDTNACAATSASSRFLGAVQQNQTLLTSLMPGYNGLVERINMEFEPNGEQMVNQYTSSLTTIIDRNLPSVKEALRRCRSGAQVTVMLGGECETAAFATVNREIRAETERYFSTECPAFAAVGARRPSASTCGELKTQFLGILDRSEQDNRNSTVEQLVIASIDIGELELIQAPRITRDRRGNYIVEQPTATPRPQGPTVTGQRPPGYTTAMLDQPRNTGVSPTLPDTTADEDVSYPTDPAVIEAIRTKPVTVEPLPPIQQTPTYQTTQEPSRPTQLSSRFSTTGSTNTTQQQQSRPTQTTQQTTQQPSSPTQLSNRFSTTGTTTTQPSSPTSSSSESSSSPSTATASSFSSYVPMVRPTTTTPSTTNSAGQRLGSSQGRTDVENRQLPLNQLANQATRSVAAVGQTVLGATREAQAAVPPPLPKTTTPVVSPVAAVNPVSPAPVTINVGSTFGSPVTSPERSVGYRGRGENAINPIIPVRGGSGRRPASADARSGGQGGDDRERPARGAAARRGPTAKVADASVDGDASAGADDESEDETNPRSQRRVAGESAAPSPGGVAAARPTRLRNTDYARITDQTVAIRYISRMQVANVPGKLVDSDFLEFLNRRGIAVRGPNGQPVGAKSPSAIMELCKSQQQYVLEGTCKR